LAAFLKTFVFELPVGLHHGVGVDGHLGRHLFHRRQLVTNVQYPHPDDLLDLLCQLQIRGHSGVWVQLKLIDYLSTSLLI